MTTTYIVTVREDEELLRLIAEGLISGDVVAAHKVAPDDVPWLRPDTMVRA